jgi:hypothetical protein
MFGVGTLFGVVMGGVLYAPPELANQPAPWQLWARMQGAPVVDTHVSGAGPAPVATLAPLATAAPVAPAAVPTPAAPEPVAAASAPMPEAQPALAAASAPVVVASRAPAKRKVHVEESTVAAQSDSAPSQQGLRVAPEPLPAPVDLPPARADGEANADPSR